MPRRPLGRFGFEVSRLSLGSWRTFERISRDAGRSRSCGLLVPQGSTSSTTPRYNDETGNAVDPDRMVRGALRRAVPAPQVGQRNETIVCNKLWWEFWPEQSAAEELESSLGRMGFDHIDVIYAERATRHDAARADGARRRRADLVGSCARMGRRRLAGRPAARAVGHRRTPMGCRSRAASSCPTASFIAHGSKTTA